MAPFQSSPAISFRVKVAPLPIRCLLEVRIARALADVVVFHSAQVSFFSVNTSVFSSVICMVTVQVA